MTGIGMGLVFVAILALWGLMDVLVKITRDRPKKEDHAEVSDSVVDETPESAISSVFEANDKTKMHKAAAAAVAIALAYHQRAGKTTLQNKDSISPWQATRRTNILNQSANLLNRKSRGSIR
jgi:Na+-transporting methylmalonyl-CoA/oxaloacetate decarboxylase gamma subunit